MPSRDWLQIAKDQIYVDPQDGVSPDEVIPAALIAIAEELRRTNDRPVVVIDVSGEQLTVPESVARALQQNIEDRISE